MPARPGWSSRRARRPGPGEDTRRAAPADEGDRRAVQGHHDGVVRTTPTVRSRGCRPGRCTATTSPARGAGPEPPRRWAVRLRPGDRPRGGAGPRSDRHGGEGRVAVRIRPGDLGRAGGEAGHEEVWTAEKSRRPTASPTCRTSRCKLERSEARAATEGGPYEVIGGAALRARHPPGGGWTFTHLDPAVESRRADGRSPSSWSRPARADPGAPGRQEGRARQGQPATEAAKETPRPPSAWSRHRDGDLRQGEADLVKVKRIEKPLLLLRRPDAGERPRQRLGLGRQGPAGRADRTATRTRTNRRKWVFAVCNTSGGTGRARGRRGLVGRERLRLRAEGHPGCPGPGGGRRAAAAAAETPGPEVHRAPVLGSRTTPVRGLRRLDRPLHTYQDEDAGILEGGLYTLANGTNPEILLFVEARIDPKDGAKPVWQFTVGRLATPSCAPGVRRQGSVRSPRGNKLSGRDKPYWLGFINTDDDVPGKP